MLRFFFYAMVAFLLLWSLGILMLVASTYDTWLVWVALTGLWGIAVAAGRVTQGWLRNRDRGVPQPREQPIRQRSALAAGFGSTTGLLIWQGVGSSMILGTIGLLLFAFMGGLMWMKSPL